MGDITDDMLNGITCQECCQFLMEDGGDPPGHPVTCGGCEHEHRKKALKDPNLPASERLRLVEEERAMWARIKRAGSRQKRR